MKCNHLVLFILAVLLTAFALTGCSSGDDVPTPAATPAPTTTHRAVSAPTETAVSPAQPTPTVIDTPIATATSAPPTFTVAPTATATEVLVGGTIRYGLVAVTLNLDPIMVEDQAGRQCVRLVWESLLQVDAKDGRLLPGLARDWSVSDDGLLVVFDLDEAASWQDGVPLTAADVVATIQYLTMPGSRSPWQIDLLAIAEVVANGDHQVRMTLSEPGCSALYDIGLAPILPAHQLSGLTVDDPATSLVGSGPFQPGEPSDDGSWVLLKNANYHTPVSLDELIVIPFESSDTLYRAWEAGQVDVAHLLAGYDGLVEKEHSVSFPAGDYMLLVFNLRRGALMDASVREALTLALDRESIAEQVSPAGATLLDASLHPDHWALSEADLPASSYDPMAAGDLLSEAGWADEDGDGWRNKWDTILSLDVITNGENPLRMSTASLVAQSYRLIGIESELHAIEWSIFLDLLFRHEFDVAVISWPFPLDPDQRMFWRSSETTAGRGFNVEQWVSDEADRLLDEAAVFPACDVAGRSALYGEFVRLMRQEYPVVPLFVAHDRLLVREGVRGLDPSAFAGPFWNAPAWSASD